MVTPDEAEELAKKFMEDFVNACKCQTETDVANVLMKMTSVCGVGMVAVVGHQDAVARLEGTTAFIRETLRKAKFKKQKPN